MPPPFVRPRRTDALVRIALLDNHWAVRAGLKTVIDLEPDMVFVGSAAGEEELRWLLRRTDPSMLVLDVNHPGRDGLALTLRLKRRVNPPRIVLYSGRGDGRSSAPQPSWPEWTLSYERPPPNASSSRRSAPEPNPALRSR